MSVVVRVRHKLYIELPRCIEKPASEVRREASPANFARLVGALNPEPCRRRRAWLRAASTAMAVVLRAGFGRCNTRRHCFE